MKKIISGFQTGVDIAAIRATVAVGVPTGGAMPLGFLTLEGPRPQYAEEYGAYELPTTDYPVRTSENVGVADATLLLRFHQSPGTSLTMKEAAMARKPIIIVYMDAPAKVRKTFPTLRPEQPRKGQAHAKALLAKALREYDTINVAGNRDADEQAVQGFLVDLFTAALATPTPTTGGAA